MQTLCLPPSTNKLSSFQFGTMSLRLTTPLHLPNPQYFLSFQHSPILSQIPPSSPLIIPIYSTLWHLNKYFQEHPKLVIQVHSNGVKRGVGNIHLPSIVYEKLTRKSRKVMGRVEKSVGIFECEGNRELGVIRVEVWSEFNEEYSDEICHLVEEELVRGEFENIPISDINLKSQKEIILEGDHKSVKPPPHPLPHRQNHHIPFNKEQEIQKLRNLERSVENQLQHPATYTKSPPKKYSKERQLHYNSRQNEIISQERQLQNQMEEDIDKLIEEMQSKVYNSSKYQDSEDSGYLNRQLGNTGGSMAGGLRVTEYGVGMKTVGEFKEVPSYTANHSKNTFEVGNPSVTSYGMNNSSNSLSNTLKKEAKTLRIRIHQLGFSGGVFNQQQFNLLSNSQLLVSFPNKQSLNIPGHPRGEAILYQSDHQIPIQQVFLNTGSSVLFQHSDKQAISLTITSRLNGKQLAYGVFELERLLSTPGSGVFIVALNNRNRLQKSTSRVRIPTSQLSTLKPINISTYNIRLELQLVSTIKNKLYQLLLYLKDVEFNKQGIEKYQIRYKTIGSFDNISVKGEVGVRLNHHMVIPVLLEGLIRDSPRFVIEVWGENKGRLIGTLELETSNLQRLLNVETGGFNDQVLSVNVDPLVLEFGEKSIRSIGSREVQGSLQLGLYFGSVRQINHQLSKLTKVQKVMSKEDKIEPRKEVPVPYDEKMGVFVKQKRKQTKEIEVQVELEEYIEEMSKSKISFEGLQFKYENQKEEMELLREGVERDLQGKGERKEEEEEFEPFVSRRDPKQIVPQSDRIVRQALPQKQYPKQLPPRPSPRVSQNISFTQTLPPNFHSIPPPIQSPTPPQPSNTSVTQSPKTLSEQYMILIETTLNKILQLSPNFLQTLKSHLKPYIQFNFVEKQKLFECIEQSAPITYQTIDQLLHLFPSNQSDLINITPLYDYFTCLQITKHIDLKLVSQQLLADYIISRLIECYMEDGCEECFVEDYDDIKEVFMKKGMYLTLRERDTFWKRYERDLGIKDVVGWNRVFIVVSENIRKRHESIINKEQEEELILETLYGFQEDQPSVVKRNYLVVTLKKMETCIESTECLLGIKASSATVVISIKQTDVVFFEDGTKAMEGLEILEEEFERTVGAIKLFINGDKISESVLGLNALGVGELEGTYSFKDGEGSFCGLVRLGIQHVKE